MKFIILALLFLFTTTVSADWYVITKSKTCKKDSPSEMIKNLQTLNNPYKTDDVIIDKKMVGVIISAPPLFDGIVYIKSLELCDVMLEIMIEEQKKEIEKYK